MLPFSEQFMLENSFEINYKSNTVKAFHEINLIGNYQIELNFVESNSTCNQAIVLFVNNFKGVIKLNDNVLNLPTDPFAKFVFWMDSSPEIIHLNVFQEEGYLTICNGSDPIGTKSICRCRTGGCAMIVKNISPDKYRFYCNDYENDDDFNDLIFDMEISI